jgi:serine protease Do
MHFTRPHVASWLIAAALIRPVPEAAAEKQKLWSEPDPQVEATPIPSLAPLGSALAPAVVSIVVTQTLDPKMLDPMFKFFEDFFGGGGSPEKFENKGVGSGVIINSAGYVVTNDHVIRDATSIVVVLKSGEEYDAEVIGSDPDTDVALLHIEAEDLPTVPLGDSDTLEVGDWVVAIGNPFGLSTSMTLGIVSALGRHEVGPHKEHKYQNFIQTDAPINPGSSGGPLFDLAGNVVGLNTAINAAGQGIGFAIPINMVKPLLPHLLSGGGAHRSWLGVSIQTVTAQLAKALSLEGSPRGALVADVVPGSPAHEAGLEPGDIVIGFDGEPIGSVDELSWLAATAGAGTEVELSVWREDKERRIPVELGSLPGQQKSDPAATVPDESGAAQEDEPDLGVELAAAQPGGGVEVVKLDAGSPLGADGLEQGDVILAVDGREVLEPAEVTARLEEAAPGDVVLLYVDSSGTRGFLTYTP